MKTLERLFPNTDRENWRDWRLYLMCRVVGHRITVPDEYDDQYCTRCGDTMFGYNKWQS